VGDDVTTGTGAGGVTGESVGLAVLRAVGGCVSGSIVTCRRVGDVVITAAGVIDTNGVVTAVGADVGLIVNSGMEFGVFVAST
jgi:hypothetical protein